MQELQAEQRRETMTSSSAEFRQKPRTAQQPQPDDPNRNTTKSMVKTAHRTLKVGIPANVLVSEAILTSCAATFSS
jgi:hypothetical protein